jgi:hypothetical protein
MNKLTGRNIFLGIILSSNLVVADDIKRIEPGLPANADLTRRATPPASSLASATEAASATTNGTSQLASATNALPPLPPDVTELRFNEFFRQPIGPRGLEYTEKLRALEGRRIRILGFMARQTKPVDRCFLLAPVPLTLNEIEYGHADDLPATTLHVFTTAEAPARTPYTPGPLLLTGTLRIGNRLEADGRTSTVRLQLDPPTAEQQAAAHAAAQKAPATDPHAGHNH